jgi:DNA-binding NarL/FixJ family response regulator
MKNPPARPDDEQLTPKKRILVLDDHPLMREGLTARISREPDLEVCGEAESAHAALTAVGELHPDLVLADITLPDKSGLDFIKDCLAMHPSTNILVISMHDESIYAERVLRAGGRGYIMKQEGGQKILAAMRKVLDGRVAVSEGIAARLLESITGSGPRQSSSPLAGLTDREFEVFTLIGDGRDTREIAERLHISTKTVEVHRSNIKQKLGLKSMTELISTAIRSSENRDQGRTEKA